MCQALSNWGGGLRKPFCSIIVMAKTSHLKNNNKSGILTYHLEAERQGGYREPGEKGWVAGTQRCPAEEPSTTKNDTRSPLRLSARKGQSCGLFCSVFLFPSFRDLRILFLPSLEVKPSVPLKVTHTHTLQHYGLSRGSMEGAPKEVYDPSRFSMSALSSRSIKN